MRKLPTKNDKKALAAKLDTIRVLAGADVKAAAGGIGRCCGATCAL